MEANPLQIELIAAVREHARTELACDHVWVEGVDENNQLIEPAFDVCISCGEVRQ